MLIAFKLFVIWNLIGEAVVAAGLRAVHSFARRSRGICEAVPILSQNAQISCGMCPVKGLLPCEILQIR